METLKYQLQKQIVEALKTNNNELYALLKTQWAHRFGVESLVELDDIDLSLIDEDFMEGDLKANDQLDDVLSLDGEISSLQDEKDFSLGKEENFSNKSKNTNNNQDENIKKSSFDIPVDVKASEDVAKIKTSKSDTSSKNSGFKNNNVPKVDGLIPLPPKARYSYLKKWLVRK